METLVTSGELNPARNAPPGVPEVMLYALAGVESDFTVDAVGDGGNSIGLWQIYKPIWDPADTIDRQSNLRS